MKSNLVLLISVIILSLSFSPISSPVQADGSDCGYRGTTIKNDTSQYAQVAVYCMDGYHCFTEIPPGTAAAACSYDHPPVYMTASMSKPRGQHGLTVVPEIKWSEHGGWIPYSDKWKIVQVSNAPAYEFRRY